MIFTKTNLPHAKRSHRGYVIMKYNLRMIEELEKRPLEDSEMELQMF